MFVEVCMAKWFKILIKCWTFSSNQLLAVHLKTKKKITIIVCLYRWFYYFCAYFGMCLSFCTVSWNNEIRIHIWIWLENPTCVNQMIFERFRNSLVYWMKLVYFALKTNDQMLINILFQNFHTWRRRTIIYNSPIKHKSSTKFSENLAAHFGHFFGSHAE